MHVRTRGGLATVALVALVVTLAGCAGAPAASPGAGPDAGAPAPTSSSPTAPSEHTAADVAFAQAMIPHHRQAVTMAALADSRAASPEVRDLAVRIARAQGPEIERLRAMLAAWGAPETAGMPGMPGMMTDGSLAGLGRLQGPAFDDAFLRMMVEHHSGAVRMAAAETAGGHDPAALDLARSIGATQQQEIERMRELLAAR